jgi:hypothetical protein
VPLPETLLTVLLNPPPSVICAANSISVMYGRWREPPGLPAREQLGYHPGIWDTGGVSRDTGLVSEILGRYRGRCGSSLARLQYWSQSGRDARNPTSTAYIDADDPQRRPRRHCATHCPVYQSCSALRALRALRVLRVLHGVEQQYAVRAAARATVRKPSPAQNLSPEPKPKPRT